MTVEEDHFDPAFRLHSQQKRLTNLRLRGMSGQFEDTLDVPCTSRARESGHQQKTYMQEFSKHLEGRKTSLIKKVYFDEDADLSVLKNRTIAVIGYGNQGRAQALNMRDSGIRNIVIGNIKDESWDNAIRDGFEVFPVGKAVELADIIFMLVPDEIQGKIFRDEIERRLEKGDVLNFAHGYSIAFGFIKPPPFIDVIMVAPRMIGKGVRETFILGNGFPSYVAIEHDASGNAKAIALAISKAIGSTRYGVFETTFYEEAVIDIFHEQLTESSVYLMKMAYEVLVGAGFTPELAILELWCSGEAVEKARATAEIGLIRSEKVGSKTAQYGMMTRGRLLFPEKIRHVLKKILDDIESGKFAHEWTLERMTDEVVFNRWWNMMLDDPLNEVEDRLFKVLRKTRRKWR